MTEVNVELPEGCRRALKGLIDQIEVAKEDLLDGKLSDAYSSIQTAMTFDLPSVEKECSIPTGMADVELHKILEKINEVESGKYSQQI